jgi:urease accessory protein
MAQLRATSYARAGFVMEKPWARIALDAQDRHLRRKLLTLENGADVLVDFERPVKLENHDCLVLEDGRLIAIVALPEDLLEVRARDGLHLSRLAWHIGNRHLEAQIELHRILIRPDHVIARMLEGLGAMVIRVREPFSPEHGAYAHGH